MQGNAQYLHTECGRPGHMRPEARLCGRGIYAAGARHMLAGRATGLQSRSETAVRGGRPRWSFEARMRGFQKVLVKNPTSAFPLAQISRSLIHFVTKNRRSRKFRSAQDPLRGCRKHAFAGQMSSTFSESRIWRAFDRRTSRDGSPSGGSRKQPRPTRRAPYTRCPAAGAPGSGASPERRGASPRTHLICFCRPPICPCSPCRTPS